MRPCQCREESAYRGWNRVKVFENLGATAIVLVAPVDTSLQYLAKIFAVHCMKLTFFFQTMYGIKIVLGVFAPTLEQ